MGKQVYPFDLTGMTFGRLTPIRYTGPDPNLPHHYRWECRCACGKIVNVTRNSIITGSTLSCGCYLKDIRRAKWGLSIPKEQAQQAVNEYLAHVPVTEIARKYGIIPSTVYRILVRLGVQTHPLTDTKRQYPLDESAFNDPGPEGRYWLGFLLADGSVSTAKGRNTLSLTLALKDEGHVEAFRAYLGSSIPLYRTKRTKAVAVTISSKRLVAKVAEYGIVPHKSLTATPPACLLSDRDFWRGIIDGDGFLRVDPQNNKPMIGCYGSHPVVSAFRDFALTVCDTKASIRPVASIFGYLVSSSPGIDLVTHLYQNATVSLPRKLDIAKRIMSSTWGSLRRQKRIALTPMSVSG